MANPYPVHLKLRPIQDLFTPQFLPNGGSAQSLAKKKQWFDEHMTEYCALVTGIPGCTGPPKPPPPPPPDYGDWLLGKTVIIRTATNIGAEQYLGSYDPGMFYTWVVDLKADSVGPTDQFRFEMHKGDDGKRYWNIKVKEAPKSSRVYR